MKIGGANHRVQLPQDVYNTAWSKSREPVRFITSILDKVINREVLATSTMYGYKPKNPTPQRQVRMKLYDLPQFQALLEQAAIVFRGCMTDNFMNELET